MSNLDKETLYKFISNIARSGDDVKIVNALNQLLSIFEVSGVEPEYKKLVEDCIEMLPETRHMGSIIGPDRDMTDQEFKIMEQRYWARKKREEEERNGRC